MSVMNSNKKLRKLIPKRAGNIYLAFNNYDMMQTIEFSRRKATEQIVEKVIPDISNIINTVVNAVPTDVQDLISSTINSVASSVTSTNNSENNQNGLVTQNSTPSSVYMPSMDDLTSGLQNLFSQGSKLIDTINESIEAVNIESSSFLQELDKILLEETSSSLQSSNPISETMSSNNINLKSSINTTKSVITDNLNSLKNILNVTAQTMKNEAEATASGRPIGSTFEFSPTPQQTWEMIAQGYNIQKNVLFKFLDDDIDQSKELDNILRLRGCDVVLFEVPGNHLTPNSSFKQGTDENSIYDSGENDKFIRYLGMSINRLIEEFNNDLLDSQVIQDSTLILPSSNNKTS